MTDAPQPTSPTDPLATFPPLPEAERDRSAEFYGFVALSLTYLLFVIYLAWALLPDSALEALGVAYYPSREWALLVPAWTVVLVLLTYWSHLAIALFRAPALSEPCTLTVACGAPLPPLSRLEPVELPIGLVNRALYKAPGSPLIFPDSS
ncbi:PIG-P-domain-containing protein [Peniophora sp. CONT]|nr:PIG-P-domain-containing protein [Peniophora sp. CONT]